MTTLGVHYMYTLKVKDEVTTSYVHQQDHYYACQNKIRLLDILSFVFSYLKTDRLMER